MEFCQQPYKTECNEGSLQGSLSALSESPVLLMSVVLHAGGEKDLSGTRALQAPALRRDCWQSRQARAIASAGLAAWRAWAVLAAWVVLLPCLAAWCTFRAIVRFKPENVYRLVKLGYRIKFDANSVISCFAFQK